MLTMTPALPEMFMLAMICVVLLVDVVAARRQPGLAYLIAQLSLLGALVLTPWGLPRMEALNGQFIFDAFGNLCKLFIYLTAFVTLTYSRHYLRLQRIPQGDYALLLLFAVLGMMVLVSAHSLLIIYLGLEIMSLALYAMVALHRHAARVSEAAMKYFIMGALASGMLLYGISLIYGVTGYVRIPEVAQYVANAGPDPLLLVGLAFVVVGLGFKFGAAPFHMWIPDVYQGAHTPATLFVSSAPKIAALAMALRILVGALSPLQGQWQQLFMVLAIASMGLGNVVAIAQTSLKRMLAYSAIAHVGFMCLGLVVGTSEGYASALHYILVYSLMSLGGFALLLVLERGGETWESLEDLKGLGQRNPGIALMMLIIVFSMAGIPPTIGFFAKLWVLQALVHAHFVWLAVLALGLSIVGVFYYLRVVRIMYFEAPDDPAPWTVRGDLQLLFGLNGLVLLALGLFPAGLLALCIKVFA